MTRLFIFLLALAIVAIDLPACAAEKPRQPCDSTKCCIDPCDCCRAKMKVGKRATRVLDPDCYTCCPETEKEKVEKTCYNVCAEPVCVPAFRWPWDCCCTPKCGKVRAVNVLEKAAYECDECVTEWKVKRKRCCGCSRCTAGNTCDVATEAERDGMLAKFGKWLLR